ncbi:S-adenosyl-L-methionine-dependent methyltransferase, partial [Immersiella caudata]
MATVDPSVTLHPNDLHAAPSLLSSIQTQSASLLSPDTSAAGPGTTGGLGKVVLSLPSYLEDKGFKTPQGIADGPLQYAHETGMDMFEWLHANPPAGEQFNRHMGGYANGRPAWYEEGFYPVEGRLLRGLEEGGAVLVDVGGGLGHDVRGFEKRWGQKIGAGRLVLQDLERVIEQIPGTEGGRVERMVYDFYTEQPVKGARTYYLHSVLHDWPDELCVKILERIKAAMKPGYSRLLINENVIPDTGAHWETTALDVMLARVCCRRESALGLSGFACWKGMLGSRWSRFIIIGTTRGVEWRPLSSAS